jgi:hypothetical protein
MYKYTVCGRATGGQNSSITAQLVIIYSRIEREIIRGGIQGKKALKMSRKSEIIKS